MKNCSHCGSSVPTDEIILDRHGIETCMMCTEQAIERAITIKEFTPSAYNQYMWTEMFGFQEKVTRKRLYKIPGIANFKQLVDDTGTSQYYTITHPECVLIMDGDPVDFLNPKVMPFIAFMKGLSSGDVVPPFPIYVSMIPVEGQTSMKVDITVREIDRDKFQNWNLLN